MESKDKIVKVVTYPNGSKEVSFNNLSLLRKKTYGGGRKPKIDNSRLMTYAEHKATLNRNLKTLYRLDYDGEKALFVTLKIDEAKSADLSTYTAVETKLKGLLTAILYDKALIKKHGKILYITSIERKKEQKHGDFHIHSVFVFENSRPNKNSFKDKLKEYWDFGNICIKNVTDKQGLAWYFTRMKEVWLENKTSIKYVPFIPSGTHIIKKSRGFKLMQGTTDYEAFENIKAEMESGQYNCHKNQHKFMGIMSTDSIYLTPKNQPNKKQDNIYDEDISAKSNIESQ